ncbi:hypothetical protein PFTANZ_06103, partial [Plasmodium falciparum Tanzania (2000708)]
GSGGTDKSAKEVLDEIGEDVYKKVKDEAQKRSKGELKGELSQVSVKSELIDTTDTCTFDYDEHTTSANGNAKPCGKDGNDVDRFSVKQQAEYDNKKMKCSNGGACAPYRRLSLCNKNMEKIPTSTTKHDLLAEVCYAAKYEGESIRDYYPQYEVQYPGSGSGSTMCTMLARSFADIGDIVRGRDLYGGNNKRRQQLDDKLKEVFGNIYNELTSTNGVKDGYKDDREKNYYKLREDWWTANRATIWEALTCDDRLRGYSYFRPTCNSADGNSKSQANNKCRCSDKPNIDPPTYFDYVPQFLRWFEEWAEDFCRKKKKYVGIVKKYCRGDESKGEVKYCSSNGYDCEKTISRIGKVRMGKGCTDCFFACNPYVDWIDNQRKQFDKQKKIYDKEIKKYKNGASVSGRQKRSARGSNDNGYEKIFYEKLKNDGYGTVNAFLEKLNNEEVCKKVQDTEGGRINFKQVNSGSASGGTSGTSGTNNENEGTFYRSKYCQPCPDCGVRKKRNATSGWEERKKNDENCKSGKLYEPNKDANPSPIRILKSGEGKEEIEKKLEAFCEEKNGGGGGGGNGGNSEMKELHDEWKCYEFKELREVVEDQDEEEEEEDEVENAGGLCILQKTNGLNVKKQKTFYDFFYYWVAHMLKDSIHWRTKRLKSCISNGTTMKCKNGCNTKCDCFLKWVNEKKTEWTNIKEHFGKQEAFKNKGEYGEYKMLGKEMESPDFVLEGVLQIEFLKDESTDDSAQDKQNSLDSEELKHLKEIKQLLDEEKKKKQEAGADGSGTGSANGKKTIMDKLIEHEEGIATKCLTTHKEKCEDPQRPSSVARSDTYQPQPPAATAATAPNPT